MMAAFRLLHKQIFDNANLALATRMQLLDATGETRLLFNAGAWTPPNRGETSFLRPQLLGVWRVFAGMVNHTNLEQMTSEVDVREAVGRSVPVDRVRASRLPPGVRGRCSAVAAHHRPAWPRVCVGNHPVPRSGLVARSCRQSRADALPSPRPPPHKVDLRQEPSSGHGRPTSGRRWRKTRLRCGAIGRLSLSTWHSTVRVVACDICGKQFRDRKGVDSHPYTAHGQKSVFRWIV